MAQVWSSRAGMGSVPFSGGVTFRVWAPDADAVAVIGDFNGWGAGGTPLVAEPTGGLWSADVPNAVAGQAYQYLVTTAVGTTEVAAGGQLTRVDPYARQVRGSGDATVAVIYDETAFVWGDDGYVSPGWDELVIYELHVGSFNDQAPGAVGTLADVTAKLRYLQDLGVNAVELLPLASFRGAVSWGYNPGAPYAVEEAYGGPDALKAFVRAAHARGIAVILDVVYNHLGPEDSILWEFDGSGPSWPGGLYFYGGDRAQTRWGSRPDYGRSQVRQYLLDNAVGWLREYRLDGLRLDATAWIRNADGDGDPARDIPDGWRLLQEINDAVDAGQPWKVVIAEDMQGNTWITRPTATGGAGFDAQWDPDFVGRVRGVLEEVNDDARDMGTIRDALQRSNGPSAFDRVVFTESHDADGNGRTRVPTEIDPAQPDSWWSKKRSTLGATLVLTAPGIPLLFQGQEFLEQHPFIQAPAPLDWSNTTTYAGILTMYRDLIRLRRDWYGMTRGLRGEGLNVFHVNDHAKVIAYHRYDQGGPGDDVLVVLNFADVGYTGYRIGVPRSGNWRIRFNSDWTGYDATFHGWASRDTTAESTPQDGFGQSAAVGIGPYTAIILSQDP